MSPTCGLFQIPKIRVFFCFFSGFGPIFLFLCFVLCFGGVLSVLALKKLVEFNSVCKIPLVLFAVQSVPSFFMFHSCSALFYLFMFLTPSLGVMGT